MGQGIDRRQFLRLAGIFLKSLFSWRVWEEARTATHASSPDSLQLVSSRPERPHLVAPGSSTTFVVRATNPYPSEAPATLSIVAQSEGWSGKLAGVDPLFRSIDEKAESLDFTLAGDEACDFLAELRPAQGQPSGRRNSGTRCSIRGAHR